MTAFFPEIYPDELVFSACSRYHDRLSYEAAPCTSRDLFGSHQVKVATDLPTSLDLLCNSLPLNHTYSINRLLYQHTLYPLYSAFTNKQRAEDLRRDMTMRGRGAAHGRSGALSCKVRPRFLRYCLECVKEDRATWGETYWHRLHNAPGVEVCLTHRIFLDNSCVRVGQRGNQEAYVAAENVVCLSAPRPLEPEHAVLVTLAADLEWLLHRRDLFCDPEIAINRYRRLLFEKNLATHTGIVDGAELQSAFVAFYSPQLLQFLKCELRHRRPWLLRMVHLALRRSTKPAIHHLLLMNFLGCRVSDFCSLPRTPIRAFCRGPWPCLNRAADHYKLAVVKTCQIRQSQTRRKKPIATFSCECGFVYCRLGPDRDPAARFQSHRTTSYGEVWYGRLRALRLDQRLTQKEVASQLGVTVRVIQRELKRLVTSENVKAPKKNNKGERQSKKEKRACWLRTLEKHPTASRSQLNKIVGAVTYHYLLYEDRNWYEANAPSRKKTPRKQIVNWKLRDIDCANRAREIAASLIDKPGKPVRASRTAILQSLGLSEVFSQRPHLLPRTAAAISEVAESCERFIVRRIQLVVNEFGAQGITFSPSRLQRKAQISNEQWRNPRIREAVVNIAGFDHLKVQ